MTAPHSNGNHEANQRLKAEEATLTKILSAKMEHQDCLQAADREAVAYRISEIMVAAKDLYTRELPRLLDENQDQGDSKFFEDLAGLRMIFFHLRDLITDFDEAFLDAMTNEREAVGEELEESSEEDDPEEL